MSHIPVLLQEVLAYLAPEGRTIERAIDGTLGAGGHSRALLEAGAAFLLSFDLDQQAIDLARPKLEPFAGRYEIIHDSYAQMADYAHQRGWDHVDTILLDLGLSSMQLDTPERGFAFMHDGPLDMRFNPHGGRLSASDMINTYSADELADIFYRYGEEPNGRKIAHHIVKSRPIHTTRELADVVSKAVPRKPKQKIHPATLVFQGLRIAVNDELQTVEKSLHTAVDLLQSGGRLAVISFHSLEDRIVKQVFKEYGTEIIQPPGMASIVPKEAVVELVTRKPIIPSDQEIAENPRSRSSKLRVVEKL